MRIILAFGCLIAAIKASTQPDFKSPEYLLKLNSFKKTVNQKFATTYQSMKRAGNNWNVRSKMLTRMMLEDLPQLMEVYGERTGDTDLTGITNILDDMFGKTGLQKFKELRDAGTPHQ